MLDGILGRGFSSKCKSLIKPMRTRIDVLRRRKEATQRFLKGNLAQLLAQGLDIDAYGRTEEFLTELNLLSCYDFIEQSYEYILKQLSVMQKQRECPEECREAVGSLMFAAARYSDLPELRDLRDTFQERYGGSLEHFVNREFVEKLALRPPSMEKKLQLLQDIALEFSIKWDSRGFKQRMENPSAVAQDQPKKNRPIHDHDDKYKLPNGKETVTKIDKRNHSSKDRIELTDDRQRVHNGGEDNVLKRDELYSLFFTREELTADSHKPLVGTKQTIPKRDNYDIPFQGRQEFTGDRHESANGKDDKALKTVKPGHSSHGRRPEFVDGGYEVHNDRMNSVPKRDGKPEVAARVDAVPRRREGKDVSSAGYSDNGQPNTPNSTSKVQEEETDRLKPYSSNTPHPPYIKSKDKLIPPPYIKSKASKHKANEKSKHVSSDYEGTSTDPSIHRRDNAEHRSETIHRESDHPNYDDHVVRHARASSHDHEKDVPYRDGIPLPKPKSVRRKHSKSSSRDDLGNYEDAGVEKRSSSSRRRENSRRGLQIDDELYQQMDEEERMIDKLLRHYSKKPSSYDPEKVRRKSKAHASHQTSADDGPDVPTRSVSLPREQTGPTEAIKVYTRANSFQPDKPAQHVHPKLPDYDDLAARIAALRGL
ncbi:hypothetical protein ACSBR2_005687 [Camellia fascicularis]